MANEFSHIYYSNHPHFTVGKVDQWGESGYLFFEGRVFSYWEDRKDQCGETYSPMEVEVFLAYAKKQNIEIPAFFMQHLMGGEGISDS
jgi:hypothetical protein